MTSLPDLLERYRRGAELLAMASTGAAGPVLDFKPAGVPWSVRQIVCHLADAEAVAVMRFRQVLAENNPTWQFFDDERWMDELDYSRRRLSGALETFRKLRADNYELLKDLPEAAFARTATHSREGVMTLGQAVEWFAEHVEGHVGEMQAIRAAYKEFRAKELATQSS
jgi:hypothetical protein